MTKYRFGDVLRMKRYPEVVMMVVIADGDLAMAGLTDSALAFYAYRDGVAHFGGSGPKNDEFLDREFTRE